MLKSFVKLHLHRIDLQMYLDNNGVRPENGIFQLFSNCFIFSQEPYYILANKKILETETKEIYNLLISSINAGSFYDSLKISENKVEDYFGNTHPSVIDYYGILFFRMWNLKQYIITKVQQSIR